MLKLDLLVWHLRQYCQPLDVVHYADESSEKVLMENVAAIERRLHGPAKGGHVHGAFIESVLANHSHPARPALVWRNFRYSGKVVKSIRATNNFQVVNTPVFLAPELVDKVEAYMKIPQPVLEGARVLAERRKVTGEKT